MQVMISFYSNKSALLQTVNQNKGKHKTSVYHFADDPSHQQFVCNPCDSVEISM